MNILIVDDTPSNRKLLRINLEPHGHAIFEAGDGLEALAVLEQQPIDAVISDILMPNMDGYRLCHELRQRPNWKDLPLIHYSSTYSAPADQKLSQAVGADHYLTKPVSTQTMLQTLAQVMAKPKERSSTAMAESDTWFVMKQYSQSLVRKLEQKNAALEAAQAELLRADEERARYAEQIQGLNAELERRVRERTAQLETTNQQLRQALAQVRELSSLLPICSYCKKIRDGEDYWHSVESYIAEHTKAQFSHGCCPDCYEKIVRPELDTVVRQAGADKAESP